MRCFPLLRFRLLVACVWSVVLLGLPASARSQELPKSLNTFFGRYCNDCHADGAAEGGLALDQLSRDLTDEATFARWERIYDRVREREMPPVAAEQPTEKHRKIFADLVRPPLKSAHAAAKGVVLRRLNRREYENTVNDLFGVRANLAGMLPEDSRSHEFDNVGAALGLSSVHLQSYLNAIEVALDDAIASTTERPQVHHIEGSYRTSREGDQFIGKKWKLLADGAVVRFSGGGYPTGMIRTTRVGERGRYRVRVTGYAHQSKKPVTFSVGGTSFARGSEKPTYGFYSFQPDEPQTIELEAWIEPNYMIQIEPYGINDPERYKRKTIEDYDGPGLAILSVTLDGPLVDAFPTRGHQLLFDGIQRREIPPRNPNERKRPWYRPRFELVFENEADEQTKVRQTLRRVASAAFRRPVESADVEPYLRLYTQQRDEGLEPEAALRAAVSAIFCSPRFLYLQEPQGKLDDYALAARLSYFLTRTAPDRRLLMSAAAGDLSDPETLAEQTERLIGDPRHERFVSDFCDAWLDLREMDFTAPDRTLFPEFDDYLRYSMPRETRAFLREVIQKDLPVGNLVKSDFAMLNSRLAEHYESPPVEGASIQRVPLAEDSLRGGILSQAAVLKVTANGTNTSPVTRGAWVMERILGRTPPPPPPGISGVEPDIRGASTLRELLAKHRDSDSCNACHRQIDPPGFALESFNPIGGFRQRYRSIGGGDRVDLEIHGRRVGYRLGPPVDSSGKLPDGRPFDGYRQFRDHLAAEPEVLCHALAEKLLTFATGRELGFSDRDEVRRIVAEAAKHEYRVRQLIHLIVQSEIFRNK